MRDRMQFEKWARRHGLSLLRDQFGYVSLETIWAYAGWKWDSEDEQVLVPPTNWAPPTCEIRTFPVVKQVCKTCIFIIGAFAGAVICLMVLQAKGLIV